MSRRSNSKNKTAKPLVYTVPEPKELLPFLLEVLSNRGRNSVKSILSRGQVVVDDEVQTVHNYQLKRGQTVTIHKNIVAKRNAALTGLTILHEDEDVIVIEKNSGLLSIASPKEKQMTAHKQLMNHVKSKNPNNRIFVVHRLDRDTSGVMMFAKNEQVKKKLQDSWKRIVKERTYAALVEGRVKKPEGKIESWLRESKTLKVYSSQNPKGGGQQAITHYKVVQANKLHTLLEVQLETGRKNQIRVHMEEIGHSIVGDKKYGAKTNPISRLGLHAQILAFTHPTTGKLLRFESKIPKPFFSKSL